MKNGGAGRSGVGVWFAASVTTTLYGSCEGAGLTRGAAEAFILMLHVTVMSDADCGWAGPVEMCVLTKSHIHHGFRFINRDCGRGSCRNEGKKKLIKPSNF